MKKIVIYTFLSLLFFTCKEEPKRTNYVINGTAEGIYNGVRIHLNSVDGKGKEHNVGTRMIVNEQFSFEGKLDTPTLYNITVNSVPGKLPILLDNSDITIDINKSNIEASKITGSKLQNAFKNYQDKFRALDKKSLPMKMAVRNAALKKDLKKQDSLTKRIVEIENKKTEYTINAIKENKDNFFSLFLLRLELNNPKIDVEKYLDIFNDLSSELKTSKTGAEIKLILNNLKNAHQKEALLEIGKVAPNFEAPTPEDKMVALNDLKGKVTIIDFWAAWCGPCRRENPNVVKIYNEYHDQGLEIIGVSLDGSRGQNDPKKAWLDAVEKDQLTWTHVSYLQYFNDPVAQLYNIKSIPATYILDKDGKIAAKNLRGNALRLKVEELLNK